MGRLAILLMTAASTLALGLSAAAQSPAQDDRTGPARVEANSQSGLPATGPRAAFVAEPTMFQAGDPSPAERPAGPPASAAEAERIARMEKQIELQQKQMKVLEQMLEVLEERLKKPAVAPAAVEELQAKNAAIEARSQQAARRDQETADQIDGLNERFDAAGRYEPPLPAPLKELFLPSGTSESPLTINGQFRFFYSQLDGQPGIFDFPAFSPYFLLQLNQNWLLAASLDIGGDGAVELGECQFNWFVNDWLTVVGGRFITPIGFFNERLNHEWINRLPDEPLMFRQVSPQITTDGVELRGAHYLFGSPVKLEYMLYGGNGFQVDPTSPDFDINDLEGISGGSNLFNANAIGGRLGLWVPSLGVTVGVSAYHNTHYMLGFADDMNVWQFDAGWRKGNWDVRFECADTLQQAADVIGNDIHRRGSYFQVAYRPYDAQSPLLSKTEVVGRFSSARFGGIDPGTVNLDALVDAPVDRDQYTIGVNYWIQHAMVWKFAYEINHELHGLNLHDNVFMSQFVWAF